MPNPEETRTIPKSINTPIIDTIAQLAEFASMYADLTATRDHWEKTSQSLYTENKHLQAEISTHKSTIAQLNLGLVAEKIKAGNRVKTRSKSKAQKPRK